MHCNSSVEYDKTYKRGLWYRFSTFYLIKAWSLCYSSIFTVLHVETKGKKNMLISCSMPCNLNAGILGLLNHCSIWDQCEYLFWLTLMYVSSKIIQSATLDIVLVFFCLEYLKYVLEQIPFFLIIKYCFYYKNKYFILSKIRNL